MKKVSLLLLLLMTFFTACEDEESTPEGYKTQNVVVVVMDGARFSETWGDPTHQYIPKLANEVAPIGVVSAQFYNDGPTYTSAGHTAITTGHYQELNNAGNELPENPSIFQYWTKANNKESNAAWVIASKDKLEILADCEDAEWSGQYNPSTDCGVRGLGSGYRTDDITYDKAVEVLEIHHPQLVLINFREPDYSGHKGIWDNYLQGISATDEYIYKLWNFIENDPYYKGTTTLFVTNDHGRHLDDVGSGFTSHGDSCDGCRHINLFACGPDFKTNHIIEIKRGLIDIPATIAELLAFEMPSNDGQVMLELFK